MQNLELLLASLEYIESHLSDEIKTDDIAAACFCSKSTLEKMFHYVYGISVRNYIIRRRMTLAARELTQYKERSILEIALKYGYSTHESFTRAFLKVWNCNPSKFRSKKFTELFPRFHVPRMKGDEYMMQRRLVRHVDISELYDLFQERKGCWFVCCDIKEMMKINDISLKAGDLAILEQIRRLTFAAGENDMVFRVGGDEFCILTDSTDKEYAEKIAKDIMDMNGECFDYENQKIPLTLYATVAGIQSGARYEELFSGIHNAIHEFKESLDR